MAVLLPVLYVGFAAFCIWLAVRIVNRRERWAKRTALGLGVLLAYPLSFGPACWTASRIDEQSDDRIFRDARIIATVYRPIARTLLRFTNGKPIEHPAWTAIRYYGYVGEGDISVSGMAIAYATDTSR
jgi:hypothetical protein